LANRSTFLAKAPLLWFALLLQAGELGRYLVNHLKNKEADSEKK
jgi:hypothetical protein